MHDWEMTLTGVGFLEAYVTRYFGHGRVDAWYFQMLLPHRVLIFEERSEAGAVAQGGEPCGGDFLGAQGDGFALAVEVAAA